MFNELFMNIDRINNEFYMNKINLINSCRLFEKIYNLKILICVDLLGFKAECLSIVKMSNV